LRANYATIFYIILCLPLSLSLVRKIFNVVFEEEKIQIRNDLAFPDFKINNLSAHIFGPRLGNLFSSIFLLLLQILQLEIVILKVHSFRVFETIKNGS
jgi:hypothetical protein